MIAFYAGQPVRHKESGRKAKILVYIARDWWEVETDEGKERWHETRFEAQPEPKDLGPTTIVFCVKCHCHYTGGCTEHAA